MTVPPPGSSRGFLERVVASFLQGRNALLLLVAALAVGAASILGTPREEEPQIVVPLADVFVEAPGSSAEEVERLVATPLERLLWQVEGVEYVYSMSMRDRAVVTVRFFVGEDREDSMVKLRDKIQANLDLVPSLVTNWLIKPVQIDDVPIVTLTLSGRDYDGHALRRLAEEVKARLEVLPELSQTTLVGGLPREIRIEVLRERLQARELTLLDVQRALADAAVSLPSGGFDRLDEHLTVVAEGGFRDLEELADLVVAVRKELPVRLREVASIRDTAAEPDSYVRIVQGRGGAGPAGERLPAVTLGVAKQQGTDATRVAARVLEEAARIRAEVLPEGVDLQVTRNYGVTADQKVNDLLQSILFVLATVVVLLFFTMGWREALIVAVAVPVSFSLALFVNWLLGYTINRVTLFALILSLGLVVDDPIANVDNCQRHIRKRAFHARDSVLNAVGEVLPPVIMSTLAIIVSFLPMYFITGMMGPYMAPMAANVPLAVSFSTVAALSVVPWLAYLLLKHKGITGNEPRTAAAQPADPTSPRVRRFYRALAAPWVRSRRRAWLLLGVVGLLLLGSMALPALGMVPLKMLPYDNKNEFQLLLDLPEGSMLERTDAVARAFEDYLAAQPEVRDLQSYVGTASPMDFNGMVRHTYLRHSPELADIRVNLLSQDERELQSHALVLRMRRELAGLAERNGVVVKVVEVPPGPPVLSTVVAEVYGAKQTGHAELVAAAREVARRMQAEEGVADVDVMATEPHDRMEYSLERKQAALHGVGESQVAPLLATALGGSTVTTLRLPGERQPLPVKLRLPRAERTGREQLELLAARTAEGSLISLNEIGGFRTMPSDPVIYHKDLLPVVYVLGEMAGRAPGEAVLALQSSLKERPLPAGIRVDWAGEGEWQITLRVFRDLGLAFGAALLCIYLLLTVETRSLALPLLVMLAIPLTAIGIMPGFALLNLLFAGEVGGYPDHIFFTATAMIGMIALGGIVVRNSLVLIEFIHGALEAGSPLREAIFESGAVRLRPIVLTAATTALGAWPITLDPIFSGLAWALIFGLIASTLFTLVVVPAVFYLLYERKYAGVPPASPS